MSVKIQFNIGQGDSRKNAPELLSFEIQVASSPSQCPSFDLLTLSKAMALKPQEGRKKHAVNFHVLNSSWTIRLEAI